MVTDLAQHDITAEAGFELERSAGTAGHLHRTIAEQREAEVRATAGWDTERVAARTRWWPEPGP